MPIVILLSLLFAALIGWHVRKRLRTTKRDHVFSQPLPYQWKQVLTNNIPLYRRIPNELLSHLHGCIQLFLYEKEYVGHGVEIDDEIRLTIAGNACMLLLNRHQRRFTNFKTIIIYPETYVAKQVSHDDSLEAIKTSHRAGESWIRGPIVLSWGDSVSGSLNVQDGHNVILHEFAHKLDEQSGTMNGLPTLLHHADYSQWARVLNDEFTDLKSRVERGKNTVLDEYGTVSAAEFFAVATESFFEKSTQMKNKLPSLYELLSRYYEVDPDTW